MRTERGGRRSPCTWTTEASVLSVLRVVVLPSALVGLVAITKPTTKRELAISGMFWLTATG